MFALCVRRPGRVLAAGALATVLVPAVACTIADHEAYGVVADYADMIGERDYAGACALLTADAAGRDCPGELGERYGWLSPSDRVALDSATVTCGETTSNSAVVPDDCLRSAYTSVTYRTVSKVGKAGTTRRSRIPITTVDYHDSPDITQGDGFRVRLVGGEWLITEMP